jgi:NADH-quinone oxidoreductase subunit N
MTLEQLTALLPIITLAVTAVLVMLIAAFSSREALGAVVTALGLGTALAVLPAAAAVAPVQCTPLLMVDRASLFFTGLLVLGTLAVTGFAYAYFSVRSEGRGELSVLLLTATLGGTVLVSSAHFASLFLGLELLSISLFSLLAYSREGRFGLESGIKYLILSGVSSAFLLFGIALVYNEIGALGFEQLNQALSRTGLDSAYMGGGLALIVAGLAFKLSLVPFHMWTPDVYQGAPAPITGFLATVSKGAVFAILLRLFSQGGAFGYPPLLFAVSLIAIASMLLGNVLALLQDNVKRILAYSSIAHFGYLLILLLAGGALAVESAGYYLAAYFVTIIAAFGAVSLLSPSADGGERQKLDDYRGLFWRRPWLTGALTLMLLSLAGIPLTMGFVAKFYVFAGSIEASRWALLGTLIVGSAIGLFYYLRVLVTLYLEPEEASGIGQGAAVSIVGSLVLGILTVLVFWLGVYPSPLIHAIGTASGMG